MKKNKVKSQVVVIESFDCLSQRAVRRLASQYEKVYLLDLYTAYHKRQRKYQAFPLEEPDYVDCLVREGLIERIDVGVLDFVSINDVAANNAVDQIENVWPSYLEDYPKFISFVNETLNSSKAEYGFKSILSDHLGIFFSFNILLSKLESKFSNQDILFYPEVDIDFYNKILSLVKKTNIEFFESKRIHYPTKKNLKFFFDRIRKFLSAIVKLGGQAFISSIVSLFLNPKEIKKQKFTYGVTLVSPRRQLFSESRGPKFLADNNKVREEDVACFVLGKMNKVCMNQLTRVGGDVFFLPGSGKYFSHPKKWFQLFWIGLTEKAFLNHNEILMASLLLFRYLTWQRLLKSVEIKHLITHADFGASHIGRNIALHEKNVQTWYFTDSMNLGCNRGYTESRGFIAKHPFWTYLLYDHFVTWSELIVKYYSSHPGSINHFHVTGCLWAQHIDQQKKNKDGLLLKNELKLNDYFVIGVFDTGYAVNGIDSYQDGIVFAKHIYQLIEQWDDVYIVFKEKNSRDMHADFDSINSSILIEAYEKMEKHPRINMKNDAMAPSDVICFTDIVVSYVYTSTTFEALSANYKAIWHDPSNKHRNDIYGSISEVTTHGYEELKEKIERVKYGKCDIGMVQEELKKKGLLDPYMDGKAIDRFRDLLVQHSKDC